MFTKPMLLGIQNGLPDLTVNVVAAKKFIWYVGAGAPLDSSLVTITVQNRLSIFPGPMIDTRQPLKVYGSEATSVTLMILFSAYLELAGGVSMPAGFQSAASQNSVFFFGGNIPAGASLDFMIEVIAKEAGCSRSATILAQVDPYSYIHEVSRSNNWGSATINILCPV